MWPTGTLSLRCRHGMPTLTAYIQPSLGGTITRCRRHNYVVRIICNIVVSNMLSNSAFCACSCLFPIGFTDTGRDINATIADIGTLTLPRMRCTGTHRRHTFANGIIFTNSTNVTAMVMRLGSKDRNAKREQQCKGQKNSYKLLRWLFHSILLFRELLITFWSSRNQYTTTENHSPANDCHI